MALHGNYSVLLKTPGRFLSGTTIGQVRSNFGRGGVVKNMWASEARVDQNNGVPSAYRPPYTWVLAQKGNAIASRFEIESSTSVYAANLAGGLNGEAAITATLDFIQANLALVTSAVCTIATSMAFASDPVIQGKLEAAASLSASGEVTQALLGAILDAVTAITASVTVGNADIRAKAGISADIQPYTTLSPESLALSVGNLQVDSTHNLLEALKAILAAGTGSGGSTASEIAQAVWDVVKTDVSATDSMGVLVKELHTIAGLDAAAPMSVTPTSRDAGDVSLVISGDGINSTTVTRV